MLQLLFKPTAQKFCWTGFWPTIEFRAEVWNAEADQFKWNVRGRMNDGFKIYSSYGDEVIAQEKNERFCKWHLEFLCLKERTKENEVPIVTISRSGNYLWGHEKRPLDLFLEGKARVFESRRFKIIHRDCKNDLEISETAKVSDQLTAVWFCFWVWYRIWNDDS